MALAMLLWFLAALAILVSGLALIAKTDVRYTQLAIGQAKSEAAADGAVELVLAGLVPADPNVASGLVGSVIVGGMPGRILVTPAKALLDVRVIGEDLLQPLFHIGAGLSLSESARLAQSVVQWRSAETAEDKSDAGAGVAKVQVIEDILAVPGVTRDIFERIRWLICSGCSGAHFSAGGIQVQNAPKAVKEIVAYAHPDLELPSAEIAKGNSEAEPGFIKVSGRVRVDVRINTGAEGIFQRSVWLTPSDKNPNGWRVLRKIPATAVPSMNFDEY